MGEDQAVTDSEECIFVDQASGLIHIKLQACLNLHETLKGKQTLKTMAARQGAII